MVDHKFTLLVAELLRGKKVSHQKKKYHGEKSFKLKGKVSRRKKKIFRRKEKSLEERKKSHDERKSLALKETNATKQNFPQQNKEKVKNNRD